MKYKFLKELYNKEALFKAAYNFTDKTYIHIDADDQYYYVNIKKKDADSKDDSEEGFQNEMIAQMVRQNVMKRTERIRELLLARAFSSTVIENKQYDENDDSETDDLEISEDINDILKDWFEKYE